MNQKSAVRLLARLTDLRLRREDQARLQLALGQDRERAASDALYEEEIRKNRIEASLPAFFKLRVHQVAALERPTDRFATLVQAVQADRQVLADQSQRAEAARSNVEKAAAEVEGLRAEYMQAMRRRRATEALGAMTHRSVRRRQELRDEDLAADPARTPKQEATP